MNPYLHLAADVLLDPEKTYEAKEIARQILLNAGVSVEQVQALVTGQVSPDDIADSIFFA